jgi:hypothetical protein
VLVLFELGAQLVGADGRDVALVAETHGLVAVAERSGPAGTGVGDVVETIAAA